jgi:hypothetical protein
LDTPPPLPSGGANPRHPDDEVDDDDEWGG